LDFGNTSVSRNLESVINQAQVQDGILHYYSSAEIFQQLFARQGLPNPWHKTGIL
jgi:hypothetical protein